MLLTLITFIIILSVLVFVHELGHFWVARKSGVKAEEFGFGFPPRIIGLQKLRGERLVKVAETENIDITVTGRQTDQNIDVIEEVVTDKISEVDRLVPFTKWRIIKGNSSPEPIEGVRGDTIYSLNWVPIGGFVKIKGEDGESQDEPDSFSSKPIWQRAIILLAGVTMNIILAAVLIAFGFMIGLPQVLDNLKPGAIVSDKHIQIVEVLPNSPASLADIKIGDMILTIDGKTFSSGDELKNYVAQNKGKILAYNIKRGSEDMVKYLKPEVLPETNSTGVGVGIVETGLVQYPFFRAVWEGVKTTVILVGTIIAAFYDLFRNLFAGKGVGANIAGPVGIAVLTGQVARLGFVYVLQFAALLSINLAIINAVPFPALDGGRVLFLIIELFKGKPVKKEIEGTIHYVGFALLMLLVVAVTFKDIAHYASNIKAIWQNIFG